MTRAFIGHVQTLSETERTEAPKTSHEIVLKKISIYQYCRMRDGSEAFLYISDEFSDIFGVNPELSSRMPPIWNS
jgi:hypothetical protein